MANIREADLIASIADALHFISYYHPADYIENLVVQHRPVTVAVDTEVNSVHCTGPARWKRPVPVPVPA